MTDLIDQIEEYIKEAGLLSDIIEKSNFMIDRLTGNDELQNHYIQELAPTIAEYRTTIKSLEILFQQYFAWERKIKKTRNLRYRRLHKIVLKDLSKPVPPTPNAG